MSLDTEFRVLLRDVVREVVREEIGPRPTELQRELLTYKQVRAQFSVSERTLSRWVQEGRLKASGKGRLRRVRAADVRACLEQDKGARSGGGAGRR
jgi:excisionase family DNA binding protein